MSELNKNYIAGEWVEGDGVSRNVNPSNTNDVVGLYAHASAAQVETAIAAAKAAFPAWSRTTPQERHDILLRASTEILARREELGKLLAREEGKSLPEAIGEATRAGQIFDFFAGEALRVPGEKLASVRPNIDIELTREAVGVIGVIAPWNFPIAIPAWKIAPALAFGNCVLFKPADLVPGSAHALAEIIVRAGAPKGVFNLVMGRGSVVGQTMLEHKGIDAITFTGSVATGRKVAAACAERMRKFQLEMGGKNPLIVLDDADLKNAVECAVNGAFFSTGQRCTASSRLIVTKGIYGRFAEAMAERMKGLVVDDALKAGTHIGPVVDQSQLDQDLSYLRIGADEGAKLLAGGERVERATPGFYMNPALFTDVDNKMRVAREEIFGPVTAMIPANDYDHALAIANDTEFGLCAGICTTSLNVPTAGVDYHVPFGGRKGSSFGSREQGRYAVEFYTIVKTAYTLA
jgi:alpha-ketoglutaric semialdehyde dehydrogenase